MAATSQIFKIKTRLFESDFLFPVTEVTHMTAITPDELLDSTAIGCGLHQWSVDGGSIQAAAHELRPALEQAYDPSMPDWPNLISWDDEDGFFVA